MGSAPRVTIACTRGVAHCLLRPLLPQVGCTLDDNTQVSILTCDDRMLRYLAPTEIDIVFERAAAPSGTGAVKVLDEEIVPVASPTFARRFERLLRRHPRHWAEVPRVDVNHDVEALADWTTWFSAHDCDPPGAPTESCDDYPHLLDAAVSGAGMALGWNGFVNACLEAGKLVTIRGGWLRTRIGLYATPTRAGAGNRNAARCLARLAALGGALPGARRLPTQRQPTRGADSLLESF